MKKLVILALACAALGAFVYFYEIAGEDAREEARKLEERLVRIEQDKIDSLRIVREGAPAIVLKREKDEWLLKEPLETKADQGTVDSLLRNLTDARRLRTFEKGGESAEKFGLAHPIIVLTVEASDEDRVLMIGNKDYTGNELYVRFEGEPQVYLTSDLILTSVDKELIDWRDKTILSFDRDKVEELRIQRASEEIALVKTADKWTLAAPIKEPADEGTVSSLLTSLETSKVQEFVSESGDNLPGFGLDRPTATVRLREEGEESWRRLELGSEVEGTVFARNPSKSVVFTVKKELLKDLFKDLWEFRAKEVVDVKQDEIAKLRFERGDVTIVARHEEYKWILEVPEGDKDKEVRAYKFWYPIDDIEFESISDAPAEFPRAEIRIVVTLQDGAERSFEFSRRANEYLARQVESGRQGTISKDSFEKLDFKVDDITE